MFKIIMEYDSSKIPINDPCFHQELEVPDWDQLINALCRVGSHSQNDIIPKFLVEIDPIDLYFMGQELDNEGII